MNISINKMTTEEKIRTMEDLWDDLCHHAAEIPSRHGIMTFFRSVKNLYQKVMKPLRIGKKQKEYPRKVSENPNPRFGLTRSDRRFSFLWETGSWSWQLFHRFLVF